MLGIGRKNLLENVGFAPGGLDTGFLCLGNFPNMTIHGILYQIESVSCSIRCSAVGPHGHANEAMHNGVGRVGGQT